MYRARTCPVSLVQGLDRTRLDGLTSPNYSTIRRHRSMNNYHDLLYHSNHGRIDNFIHGVQLLDFNPSARSLISMSNHRFRGGRFELKCSCRMKPVWRKEIK